MEKADSCLHCGAAARRQVEHTSGLRDWQLHWLADWVWY